MISAIYIKAGGKIFPVESFTFSGGEEHVSVPIISWVDTGVINVFARVQSSKSLAQLLLVSEVLNRKAFGTRNLTIPYFPYARQDRVTVENGAFSLEAIGSLIGNLGYRTVTSYDLHSDVTKSYVKGLIEVTQLDIIKGNVGLLEWVKENRPIILAPDKGAAHKSFLIAQHLGLPLLQATKIRDPETGKLSHFTVESGEKVANENVLICDDICDGGGTFVELAKILKNLGAKHIVLYVTHGIFSKGYDVFEGLIDRLYSTDTFIPQGLPLPGQVPLFIHKIIEES